MTAPLHRVEPRIRTNTMPADKVARGQHAEHTRAKRVTAFLDDATFELLRERAIERGVGLSAVVRETIDAGLISILPRQ